MTARMLRRTTILFFLATGLLTLSCTQEVYKLGAVLPLTGNYHNYGEAIRNGVELAYEQINADPGYSTKLELTIVDSESDPDKAKGLLEELYGDGALAVIGGATSAEAMEMVSVADRYDRVLLSPSASSPDLTGASANFYRICPSDFRDGSKMATFVAQNLKLENVAIVAEEQPYASGIQGVFQEELRRLGGNIVEVIEYPPNTSDFAGLIERLMTLDIDGVYLAAYGEAIGSMIQELRRIGFKGKILTTHAFSSPAAIARAGDVAEGVFLTQTVFELDSDHAHVRKFVDAYELKYGERPDIFAAQGYDSVVVLAEALKGKPALPSEVPKGLGEEFSGVTGSIRFDDKGDAQKYPRVYIIGEDLLLYDYDEQVEKQREEILKQRQAIEERLKKLREEMKDGG